MKHPSLKARLLFRLLLIVGSFGVLLLLTLNQHLRTLQETEVEDKSKLVLAGLTAAQTYIRTVLRPAMYETLPKGSFVLEGMSTSFVTRKLMSDLNMAKDQFRYRRVALDPRNPEFAADAMERDYIRRFRENPALSSISEYKTVDGVEHHLTARPVVFEKSCLTCHGSAALAPREMLARYGDIRGFGRTEGEIGGLDLLLMPVEREAAALRKASVSFLALFSLGTAFILTTAHFFSDRIIVQNIGRLSEVLRKRFPDEAGTTLDAGHGKSDEIEDMVASVERFADHLREAKLALADHAATLEDKVAQRTDELSREAASRRADAQLFLDMLTLFEGGLDQRRLVDLALKTVAQRFAASRASFHCFFSMGFQAWPPDDASSELPPQERRLLLEGQSIIEAGAALVPVRSGEAIRGALELRFDQPLRLPGRELELLAAIGVQLGMSMENHEAMENLLGQKTVLEAIFEGIGDPLFLVGPKGLVEHANESAQRLLHGLSGEGRDPAQLLELLELLEPDARNAPAKTLARERDIRLQSGRSLSLRAYPLTALGGPARAIVYARDTTVEKTMLARFQQSEKTLAVGALAAGLAHEINNPLGVILLYARLLSDEARSDQVEDLEIIVRHTLQARKVLEDLMRFARPKPRSAGAVNLAETVAFIARVFGLRAAKQGVAINASAPENLPLVHGDATTLEQIVSNIVINCLDALEESAAARPEVRGRVDIDARATAAPDEIVLTIRDNGPGIPEEHLSRIFDPFFSTKDVGKGTGLGLSVVYGLVRDLGGRIEAEGHGGASFSIYFKTAEARDVYSH